MKKRAYNYKALSPEQEKYLKDNWYTKTTRVLSEELGFPVTTLRCRAYELGLKKIELERVTPEVVLYIKRNYRRMGDTEIADRLQKLYPKNRAWSKKHVSKKLGYLKLSRTKEELKKIHARNVKNGMFKICPIKAWITRGNARSVGDVVVWEGSAFIKIEKGYVPYAPWLWKQINGPVPKGKVVHVLPDSPEVPEIQHLTLKTRAEMMSIVSNSDTTIAKRFFDAKNDSDVQWIVNNHPELLDLKRTQMKLNGKLRELRKKA